MDTGDYNTLNQSQNPNVTVAPPDNLSVERGSLPDTNVKMKNALISNRVSI